MAEQIEWDDEIVWDSPVEKAASQQDASLLSKFTQSKLPEELAQDISAWWQARTKPNVPEPFDLATSAKRVGTSTAMMAGLGSVLPGVGTLAGAASGAVGGVAGEVGRNLGMSDVGTFGLEMLGGEAPAIVEAGAKGISKVVSPISYRGGRAVGLFESDRLRQESINQVKKNYFGKPAFDLDIIPENTEAFQIATKQSLGIPETTKESVSNIFRQRYYENVQGLSGVKISTEKVPASYDAFRILKSPEKTKTITERTGFITSPEHTELVDKLNVLAKSNRMSPKEKSNLNNILKLEVDPDPEVRKLFVQELTNYIQNGGAFIEASIKGDAVIKSKINKDMQGVLRETFDKYLERNLGSKEFAELKAIEKKEFEAQARDLIPSIISSKGTLPREDIDFILGNVKNSPIVKKEFSQAIMQRLSDPKLDTTAKLLSEFRKYNKDLVTLGVFDRKGLQEFYTKLNKFDKAVDKQAVKNLIMSTLAIPVTTAEVTEGTAQVFRPPMQPKPSAIPAFNM